MTAQQAHRLPAPDLPGRSSAEPGDSVLAGLFGALDADSGPGSAPRPTYGAPTRTPQEPPVQEPVPVAGQEPPAPEPVAAQEEPPGLEGAQHIHELADSLLEVALERVRAEPAGRHERAGELMERLELHGRPLVRRLVRVYGPGLAREQLTALVGDVVSVIAHAWAVQRARDPEDPRSEQPFRRWWDSRRSLVAACYADRWAGGLQGVRARIPYLTELGVTHLRLLPVFAADAEHPDGGFAVSSFRRMRSDLGTLQDLRELVADLREAGIGLMLDVPLSRTAADHPWARAAAEGAPYFASMYRMRTASSARTRAPGPLETPLAPDRPGDHRLVGTSEGPGQWDLDWGSPTVFAGMLAELLHVAGLGAEVLRVDAPCRLFPAESEHDEQDARLVLQALDGALRIAAPQTVLESQENAELQVQGGVRVAQELDLTAMLWSALAERSPWMLQRRLERGPQDSDGRGGLLPVRHHDALRWSFGDDLLEGTDLDPAAHRCFLDAFYTGSFRGSFAAGSGCLPLGEPGQGVCGTTASLAGLPQDPAAGADRALLLHAVAFSLGPVPELWLGDELGAADDPTWNADPAHARDPRWRGRPVLPEGAVASRHDLFSVAGRLYGGLQRMRELRAAAPEFDGQRRIGFDARNDSVLGYQRPGRDTVVLCLANFSDWTQYVTGLTLSGFLPRAEDLRSGEAIDLREGVLLEAHGWRWIRCVTA